MNFIIRTMKDQRGATLLEYVGLAVLILVAVWGAAQLLGQGVSDRMTDIRNRIAP